MYRRLNITLPEQTVRLVDRVARERGRSRFINLAVRHYVEAVGRANLRKRLKEGALRRAERDLRLAEEWFALEVEAGCRRNRR
jgi:CopG family transcriptional regulator/antitoxin EndoAI